MTNNNTNTTTTTTTTNMAAYAAKIDRLIKETIQESHQQAWLYMLGEAGSQVESGLFVRPYNEGYLIKAWDEEVEVPHMWVSSRRVIVPTSSEEEDYLRQLCRKYPVPEE